MKEEKEEKERSSTDRVDVREVEDDLVILQSRQRAVRCSGVFYASRRDGEDDRLSHLPGWMTRARDDKTTLPPYPYPNEGTIQHFSLLINTIENPCISRQDHRSTPGDMANTSP